MRGFTFEVAYKYLIFMKLKYLVHNYGMENRISSSNVSDRCSIPVSLSLKTRKPIQGQVCILDHLVTLPRVARYVPWSCLDNFPKAVSQINSAEPDLPS